MIKLYRRNADGVLEYHEAWRDDEHIVEHWGIVGERGTTRHHPFDGADAEADPDLDDDDDDEALEVVLAAARELGFAEFPGPPVWLEVQYDLEGRWGNPEDLELRNAIMAHLDEALGWAGVGHCDGGSIGSGAMEVACVVVDAAIGRQVIEAAIKDSSFPRFSRINQH